MFQSAFSGYSASNIESVREFYGNTLGLELDETMGGIQFKVGGQQVFIYLKENHQPAAFTVLNFVINDIDAAVEELSSKGVKFERYDTMPFQQDEKGIARGKQAGMGPNIAWFKDPCENILALVEQ